MTSDDLEIPKDMLHNIDDWKGNEYSPFNPELDDKYPIDKLLSKENLQAISIGLSPNNWIPIFSKSPAINIEAEIMMGQFLTLAARAGQWVDLPSKSSEKVGSLKFGNKEIDMTDIKLDFAKGKERLERLNYIKTVADDDGYEMVKPQKQMMEFFQESLKQYGPKEV